MAELAIPALISTAVGAGGAYAANKLLTPDTSAQQKQIADAQQQQTVANARQLQTEQDQAATQDQQTGLLARAPRGRRLLQAATGDTGIANKSSTLG